MLAAVAFCVGVFILGQTLLQAGLAACLPVPARTLTPTLMQGEVNDVELLLFALG